MNSEQYITLSESVSSQCKGIVLVWSRYNTSTSQAGNYEWTYFFIPKHHVSVANGTGIGISQPYFGMYKYIYVYDTQIKGYVSNQGTGVVNGINYNNSNYVLRYVIGI